MAKGGPMVVSIESCPLFSPSPLALIRASTPWLVGPRLFPLAVVSVSPQEIGAGAHSLIWVLSAAPLEGGAPLKPTRYHWLGPALLWRVHGMPITPVG